MVRSRYGAVRVVCLGTAAGDGPRNCELGVDPPSRQCVDPAQRLTGGLAGRAG